MMSIVLSKNYAHQDFEKAKKESRDIGAGSNRKKCDSSKEGYGALEKTVFVLQAELNVK